MENHKLVMPEHLNHYGFLFGGYLLQWVDEYTYIAATMEYPGYNFVTVAMDKVEFKKSVRKGTILKFIVEKMKQGNTSVEYEINVFRKKSEQGEDEMIFSTHLTMVSVDEQGQKKPLPK
jgi:acyl-CoA hydrolase